MDGELKITNIKLRKRRIKRAHHTNDYRTDELILRRGQSFEITLELKRALKPNETINFEAEIVKFPEVGNNIKKATFSLSTTETTGRYWSAVTDSIESTTVKVSIKSPVNAIIGSYRLTVQLGSEYFRSWPNVITDFILLFNPWESGDDVYLEDELERQEYVLSDSTIMYQGSEDNILELGWNLGQFEDGILKICFDILRKQTSVPVHLLNDPKQVSRVLSEMLNSEDDNGGVLVGEWGEKFPNGVHPGYWTGSVKILKQWAKSGPVQYGQCWVYAGVLCTVSRCLGIPNRTVTNFLSGHDAHGTLSINYIYDRFGQKRSEDSFWIYHVWNEAWFTRNDIGPFYNGWQVVDATPQEESDGVLRLGPTSVTAVKEGDVMLKYDGLFVFSEVNADINFWIYSEEKECYVKINSNIDKIGKRISTKAVGTNDRVDITSHYKYAEGTAEERRVYHTALLHLRVGRAVSSGKPDTTNNLVRVPRMTPEHNENISGKFKDSDPTVFGRDVNVILVLNNTAASKNITIVFYVHTTNYTRRRIRSIMSDTRSFSMGPNEEKEIPYNIPYDKYKDSLMDDKMLEFLAFCKEDNKNTLLLCKIIALQNPSLKIKVLNEAILNKPVNVEITIVNPLNESLYNCELHAEGSGLVKEKLERTFSMEPKEEKTVTVEFTPYMTGCKQMQVVVTGPRICSIKGYTIVNVEPGPCEDATCGIETDLLYITHFQLNEGKNKLAHHTADYRTNKLVLRRGQSFVITLELNRALRPKETINFVAEIGKLPGEENNIKSSFFLSTTETTGRYWSAVTDSIESTTVKVSIKSPVNAIIGSYKLTVWPVSEDDMTLPKMIENFILLFNPWVYGDDVYLEDELERQEYVLSDSTIMYEGNEDNILEMGWNLGQFEDGILKICLDILRKQTLVHLHLLNDAKQVSRVLSAMINSQDDKGVLVGWWGKELPNGVDPAIWAGSVEILRQWAESGPVRYGQCWVFAGVLCTVLRCLGIPNRIVTNFVSAHNADGETLSVTFYYDRYGNRIKTDGSMWVFHAWNEAWFIRNDLVPSYNGWQVVDATPQEKSAGVYRIGPTSVKAVKEGDITLRYDGHFVFSEVNADLISWIYNGEKESYERVQSTSTIGKHISTKAVGTNDRVDITSNYKYAEGTAEERRVYQIAMIHLFRQNNGRGLNHNTDNLVRVPRMTPVTNENMSGKFKDSDPTVIGRDVNVILVFNNAAASKHITVNFIVNSTDYTRQRIKSILKDTRSISMDPNEEKEIVYNIPYGKYKESLMDDKMLEVTALCQEDNKNTLLLSKIIILQSPSLKIKVLNEAILNKPVNVEITIVNPLNETLDNCKLHAEGSGLFKEKFECPFSMEPKEEKTVTMGFTPYMKGSKQMQVVVTGPRIISLNGYTSVNVMGDPE